MVAERLFLVDLLCLVHRRLSAEFAATPPTIAICCRPRLLGRLAHALDERPHDRVLVGGGEVRAARCELLLVRSRTA